MHKSQLFSLKIPGYLKTAVINEAEGNTASHVERFIYIMSLPQRTTEWDVFELLSQITHIHSDCALFKSFSQSFKTALS